VIEKLALNKAMRLRYIATGGMPQSRLRFPRQEGRLANGSSTSTRSGKLEGATRSSDPFNRRPWERREHTVNLIRIEGIATDDLLIRSELDSLVAEVCEAVRKKWDKESKSIPPKLLARFYELSSKVSLQIPSPN